VTAVTCAESLTRACRAESRDFVQIVRYCAEVFARGYDLVFAVSTCFYAIRRIFGTLRRVVFEKSRRILRAGEVAICMSEALKLKSHAVLNARGSEFAKR
jgi:hypothetical protein